MNVNEFFPLPLTNVLNRFVWARQSYTTFANFETEFKALVLDHPENKHFPVALQAAQTTLQALTRLLYQPPIVFAKL